MADGSAIEWTEATWNPTTGCTSVSPGCKNCYAATLSKRLMVMGIKKYRNNFKFTQHDEEVDRPVHWKKPRKIFVDSMSDLFHEDAEAEFILKCFDTMIRADHHTYQILTKRPRRMAEFSKLFHKLYGFTIPPHIWMGTSVENASVADRVRDLSKVKCHIRFVSFEPLLGKVGHIDLSSIDWAIIGGESGPRHRPVRTEWVRDLVEQCSRQQVRVFFKQWGGLRPKSGGRLLGGKEYNEYPPSKRMSNKHMLLMKLVQEAPPNSTWRARHGGRA